MGTFSILDLRFRISEGDCFVRSEDGRIGRFEDVGEGAAGGFVSASVSSTTAGSTGLHVRSDSGDSTTDDADSSDGSLMTRFEDGRMGRSGPVLK